MKSVNTVVDGAVITKNVAATIKEMQDGGHNDVLDAIEEGINVILALYEGKEQISEKAILSTVIGLRSIPNIIINLLPLDGDECELKNGK
ncbi:hypothetical protein [uncultured Bacteroides sp.]|uniref:hypothetical protein n=1 Tax=uncultured Bacteroides sp. TaxID=162156 RepID=UPI002AAA9B63|nr:hypothetical protein [uncultured Bacteroides sp.]